MSDDYLWDGSGETDPDIERLENLLSRYRHQPAPLKMPVKMPIKQNRSTWSRIYSPHTGAVAAAIVLLFTLAALSYFLLRQGGMPDRNSVADAKKAEEQTATGGEVKKEESPEPRVASTPARPDVVAGGVKPVMGKRSGLVPKKMRRGSPDDAMAITRREPGPSPAEGVYDGTDKERVMTGSIALLEVEAARHFEKAQVLLRSFRNAPVVGDGSAIDLSYEREQSRNLLYKNIVLRRGVEARGAYPMEDVLSSLEPILIDIANLPEKPSADEVNSIKQRMQRKEIVATLQVYSAQASLAGN